MEDIQMQVEECLKSPDIQNGMLLLGVQEEEIRRELEPFLPHIHFFIQRWDFLQILKKGIYLAAYFPYFSIRTYLSFYLKDYQLACASAFCQIKPQRFTK